MAILPKSLASVATLSFLSTLALSPLLAERNAAYLAGGFQWSRMETKEYLKVDSEVLHNEHYSGDMWGFNLRAGYKQFFGQSKRVGLRYYVTFDYNAVGRVSGTGDLADINYGAGMDFLWDFFVPKDNSYAVGFFVGFQLLGSSWIGSYMAGGDGMNGPIDGVIEKVAHGFGSPNLKGQPNIAYFQLPISFGLRANFSDKQGIELGALVPVVPYSFYKKASKGDDVSLSYHRNASLYINYIFNF
ncbi:outer membrane protein [Helicobacter cynogastricus]|uniref:outer membrane protein n=1 Tax=Helicobacter cynogastricus TaxID=329937 RepID=UPI000CF0B868|nr:outer membrane protein [Helicobacter cynogastricus]